VLLLSAAAVVIGGGSARPAGADILLPSPLGPIAVPLPLPTDPTTTTTVPDPTTTTTAPDPTSTTTAPGSTTTTAPASSTTPRPRGTTTTTGPARGGVAASVGNETSGPAGPGATTGTHTRAARGPSTGANGAVIEPVTAGSASGLLVPDRLGSAVAPATAFAHGGSRGFDGSALAGILLAGATALVLGIAQRDAARQRRSQGSLVAPGTLRLGRDESEAEVRQQLQLMLAGGELTVTGSDCRSLQLLVQVAAHEGLEVRDPRGYVVRATNRLVQAYGVEPDRKRLPLRWAVGVGEPTVAVPDGYGFVLTRTGPQENGRLLAFSPGTEMMLWSGDCL
jgi:hypothetical protein